MFNHEILLFFHTFGILKIQFLPKVLKLHDANFMKRHDELSGENCGKKIDLFACQSQMARMRNMIVIG